MLLVAVVNYVRPRWDVFAMPYRIIRLSLEEPDRTLPMPVDGAAVRAVANTWHAPRPGDRRHEGADIFAPRGTAVFSATRGVVTRVGQNRLGGNVVFVTGPGARSYYYAHLDSFARDLDVGDPVTPDRVLGYVGTTGNARGTPPHLHFGVYTREGTINPVPLLVERP